jgi:putative ABC transport system substrate-binding protein
MSQPTRRTFLRTGAFGVLSIGGAMLSGACQLPGLTSRSAPKVRRIGFLSAFRREISNSDGFVKGLGELGYVVDQDVHIDWRFADGVTDRLPDLAAELIDLGVEVAATESTPAVVALAQASHTLPIVSGGPTRDLVDLGLAQSYARPGGNVTGTGANTEQYGKLVDLLKAVLPTMTRMAYLRNATTPGTEQQMALSQDVARKLGVDFLELQARTPDDIDVAIARAASDAVDGLVVSADTLIGDASGYRAIPLALQYHLPGIFSITSPYIDRGAFMGYSADFFESHRRAAILVDKILKGASPATLPIEQATRFELGVNLTTARALGVTIPQDVAGQVTRWVE